MIFLVIGVNILSIEKLDYLAINLRILEIKSNKYIKVMKEKWWESLVSGMTKGDKQENKKEKWRRLI